MTERLSCLTFRATMNLGLRHASLGLLAVLIPLLGSHGSLASDLPAPPPASPYAVDFNDPPRNYVVRSCQGWWVWAEEELVLQHPTLASNALHRLDANLQRVLELLPPHSHKLLQNRRIFLMLGAQSSLGGKNSGADYFQRHAPDFYPQIDPRMAGSILIYSAKNYVWLPDLWALKVLLHEFAHAWHLEQWPEQEPVIVQAHRKALRRGLYRQVLTDEGGLHAQAYAMNNPLEYFAELTCMYFAECNYPPRHRQALREYDPAGYAMIERMWKID